MRRLIHGVAAFAPLAVLLFVVTAGLWLTIADFPGQSLCVFKRVFLLDCPGCGLTRAFLLIPRGRFADALHFNVASLPLYFFFAYLLVQQISESVFHKRFKWRVPEGGLIFWVLAIVLLLLLQWVFRTIDYFLEHSFLSYVLSLFFAT